MLTDLALQVIEISLTTSVLIGILLLMVPMLQKRYRARFRYMIWLVIAVRLLIPFKLSLPVNSVEIELPKRDLSVSEPYIEEALPQQIVHTEPEADLTSIITPRASQISEPVLSPYERLGYVWLTGACAFMLFQIGAYLIFLRKLKLSHKESIPEHVKEAIWNIGVDMEIGKLPEPIITDAVGDPVLIGVLRPRILLPHIKYSEEEISFILRHEMSHYHRRDMWYKLVLLLANVLHWFNPLAYFMFAQAARDIEMVCDNDVIKNMNYDERNRYADTILSTVQRKGRVNTVFSTQFRGSKQDIKNRLCSMYDMGKKRRGIMVLCLILLCTIFGTGAVSFAYADPEALQGGQPPVIKDFMINVKAVDGKWASASSINGDTWENQMATEMKWLDEVYNKNKSNFVIKEIMPVTEAVDTSRLEYLYSNSKVFRKMSKMNNGIFQLENGEAISGFGPAYETGMMQRTAVMVDKDEPVTLDIDYKLSQGKLAVWLVSPSGKTVYEGTQSAAYQGRETYPGEKGLWSVIILAGSEENAIEGNISISLLSSEQTEREADTPSSENFSIERLGSHALTKKDVLDADLRWDGKGYVMLLYTDSNLTDNQILKRLMGIPNIPPYDKAKKEKGKAGNTVNFSQSTQSPLLWKKKITEPGTFYFYLLRINNPGKVTGRISLKQGKEKVDLSVLG